MPGSPEHMAKMRAARKKQASDVPPAPKRRMSFVDEMRAQRLPQSANETRLAYARRKAGWPPLKEN